MADQTPNTSNDLDDILKYLVMYAFRRGNAQQPISPDDDPAYKTAKAALNKLIASRVREGRQKQIRHDALSFVGNNYDLNKNDEVIAWRMDRLEELEVENKLEGQDV